MTLVVDSYAARSPQQLDDLGAIGLVAYIGLVPNRLTQDEMDALRNAHKDVALIIEHTVDAWRQGFAKGAALGAEARQSARLLGFPDARPVGLAIDDDIQPGDLLTALAHVQGFKSKAGLSWIYGTAYLIDHAFGLGYITHGMQSCSTGFYDNKRVSPHAALHQHCHPGVDDNDVLLADWGQERPPTVVTHPSPLPTPKDDHMLALTTATHTPEKQSPYIAINYADHGHSIIAVFAKPFTASPPKVTDAIAGQVLHLEPGEVAVALAKRDSQSFIVQLADFTTRTAYISQQFSIV